MQSIKSSQELINRLFFFFKYGLFWLSFFMGMRLIFMLFHFNQSFSISLSDWGMIFLRGLWMDLSMTGYILALSGVTLAILFFTGKGTRLFFVSLTILLLVVFVLILVPDMELYKHWGYRIDATPLFYLKDPEEAFASLSIWVTLLFVIFASMLFAGFYKLSGFFVGRMQFLKGKWWFAPIFLFLSATMIIPIRGGLGVAPMNPAKVYFSNNVFSNHAALNGVWNMMYGLTMLESMNKKYPEYVAEDNAKSFYESLNIENEIASSVLRIERPNIVLILLESYTSKAIETLGGKPGVTPNFSKLADQGLLFSNIYASGDRSDKGIIAVLSGFPAQSTQSIILFPPKSVKLPAVSKVLDSAGYHTTFYYGGDPDFANIRTFLYSANFRNFVTEKDFPRSVKRTKWGAPDEFVFQRLLSDLDGAKSPFFKFFFTLSSHEPFEFPDEPAFHGSDSESKFFSSIHYTDKWLGWFFHEAMKRPWYDSTLFILIADHGHRLPGKNPNYHPDKFSIPMLWLGGALDTVGVVPRVGSQVDLAKTLLFQIGYDAKEFKFSRNLLADSSQSFAYYAFNDGFGFITDSCKFVWDHTGQRAIIDECNQTVKADAFSYFKYYHDFFLGL